jgi:hypothetical protein
MQLGRLERVPLRELWANEALDFTTWLAENLDFGAKLWEVSIWLRDCRCKMRGQNG